MKGYCECGKEIDEVEYIQFDEMCEECYNIIDRGYWRGYKRGYQDALDDTSNDGDWENDETVQIMNEDYD